MINIPAGYELQNLLSSNYNEICKISKMIEIRKSLIEFLERDVYNNRDNLEYINKNYKFSAGDFSYKPSKFNKSLLKELNFKLKESWISEREYNKEEILSKCVDYIIYREILLNAREYINKGISIFHWDKVSIPTKTISLFNILTEEDFVDFNYENNILEIIKMESFENYEGFYLFSKRENFISTNDAYKYMEANRREGGNKKRILMFNDENIILKIVKINKDRTYELLSTERLNKNELNKYDLLVIERQELINNLKSIVSTDFLIKKWRDVKC